MPRRRTAQSTAGATEIFFVRGFETFFSEIVAQAGQSSDFLHSACWLPRPQSPERITPERAVYAHITSFEEVGHGGSASVPAGVTEAISVDMGCVGEGLTCDERMVSICAKDSGGPYNYDVVRGLIAAAEKMGAPYAVDVYPRYGSDVEATLRAGYDLRHGLIGSGVYASHGYERSHIEGALATLKTLAGYVK